MDAGCAANSIPLTVGIRALPKIGFTVNDSTQCFNGNSFTFTDTTRQITPVLQRIWTYSDLFQSTDSIASKSFSSAGIQTVKLDIQNTDGCVSSLTKNLYVLINNTPEKFYNFNENEYYNNIIFFKLIISSILLIILLLFYFNYKKKKR